ncbi:uncharacterized protein LOC141497751 [Macrotis lagotis]|uniref:uncharacterized protein LOC141497751 n=1 Tax=Macrotis lagotis TaxID=92651 RepID=UPI003D686EA4
MCTGGSAAGPSVPSSGLGEPPVTPTSPALPADPAPSRGAAEASSGPRPRHPGRLTGWGPAPREGESSRPDPRTPVPPAAAAGGAAGGGGRREPAAARGTRGAAAGAARAQPGGSRGGKEAHLRHPRQGFQREPARRLTSGHRQPDRGGRGAAAPATARPGRPNPKLPATATATATAARRTAVTAAGPRPLASQMENYLQVSGVRLRGDSSSPRQTSVS